MEIKVSVVDKHAIVEEAPVIVCGNSDYTIKFTFDSEWDGAVAKTARFVYIQDGVVRYQDVAFAEDTVAVPILANTKEVQVGVYSGDLRTTAPAVIPCERSIRCGTSAPADPTPNQYDQIIALILSGAVKGDDGITPHIGDNGNWWFGNEDTGCRAEPIKGLDYFTEEEKQEIIDEVLAALPRAEEVEY